MRRLAIEYLLATKERHPDHVALVKGGSRVTYAELWRRVLALGRLIRASVPGEPRPIVVAIDKSIDAIVAILAVQLGGHIYVPFDPASPPERRQSVFGYRMDPYFHHPWRATNLVTFWSRFTFHYREFLVRAFDYPVFFRWFREHTALRIVVATMAAAGVGNLVWGHVPEELYDRGLRWATLGAALRTWPYFLLLGLGISLIELYLLRKRRARRPWTLDRRRPLDVLACYLTIQFYALIEIFAHPCRNGTLADSLRLFLIGLGLPV